MQSEQSGPIPFVDHATPLVANGWVPVELLVEGQLLRVTAVGVHNKQSPIVKGVGAIDNSILRVRAIPCIPSSRPEVIRFRNASP
jgi:hypothetical protein